MPNGGTGSGKAKPPGDDDDPNDIDEALDFEEMMESDALFHPEPTQQEYEALELKAFKRYWEKVWNYFVQPKIVIKKDTYILKVYNKDKCTSTVQRTLWSVAKLDEVKRAFGKVWPGFSSLPDPGRTNRLSSKGLLYLLTRTPKGS